MILRNCGKYKDHSYKNKPDRRAIFLRYRLSYVTTEKTLSILFVKYMKLKLESDIEWA